MFWTIILEYSVLVLLIINAIYQGYYLTQWLRNDGSQTFPDFILAHTPWNMELFAA